MLHNVSRAFSLLMAGVGVAGVVFPAFRSESPVHRIPWWWWFTNGAAFLLLGYANPADLWQGVLLLVGVFSLGIGVAVFAVGVQEGKIRLRLRRGPSEWDHEAQTDWWKGAELVHVLEVKEDDWSARDGPIL